MTGVLSDIQWATLLSKIDSGRCTPFLGAGASAPEMPLGGEVARSWAESLTYPFADPGDLPGVAQYLAVRDGDQLIPKQRIQSDLQKRSLPDFSAPGQPHGVLASLSLPMYLTTNYDDFMAEALRQAKPRREPAVRIAPWTKSAFIPAAFTLSKRDGDFTPVRPLVFHLHGHLSAPDSMVLTEDDYVDYLVELGRNRDLVLPGVVQGAFTGTSLLFIGYRLSDWNFRVIHRALVGSQTRASTLHVTVQIEPDTDDVSDYLAQYYARMDLHVYWGTASDFCAELQQRWEAYRP